MIDPRFTLVMALSFLISAGHPQFHMMFQEPLDTEWPNHLDGDPLVQGVLTTDGNTVTFSQDHILRMYNMTGILQWEQGYSPGYGPARIDADDQNGFRIVALTGSPIPAEYAFIIAHFGGSGELLSERIFGRSPASGTLGMSGWGTDLQVTHDAQGNVYVLVSRMGFVSSFSTVELSKIDADGNLLWTRSLGTSSSSTNTAYPTYIFDNASRYRVRVDPSGNIVIVLDRGSIYAEIEAYQLTSEGEIIWSKRFRHGTNTYYRNYDMDITPDGSIATIGRLSTMGAAHRSLTYIHNNGTISHCDLYANGLLPQPGGYSEKLIVTATDLRVVLTSPTSIGPTQLAMIGPSGASLTEQIIPGATFEADDDRFEIDDMDVRDGTVVLLGHMTQGFGQQAARRPVVIALPIADPYSCIFTDTTADHSTFPMDSILVTEVDDPAAVDITQEMFPVPGGVVVMELPLSPLADLCSIIGIAPPSENWTQVTVLEQTLVPSGNELILSDQLFHRIEIINSIGQLVLGSTIADGQRTIPNNGWSTGIHIIRAFDKHGALVGMSKFLIY